MHTGLYMALPHTTVSAQRKQQICPTLKPYWHDAPLSYLLEGMCRGASLGARPERDPAGLLPSLIS